MPPVLLDGPVLWLCITLISSLGDWFADSHMGCCMALGEQGPSRPSGVRVREWAGRLLEEPRGTLQVPCFYDFAEKLLSNEPGRPSQTFTNVRGIFSLQS